jgi:hypothetical protein
VISDSNLTLLYSQSKGDSETDSHCLSHGACIHNDNQQPRRTIAFSMKRSVMKTDVEMAIKHRVISMCTHSCASELSSDSLAFFEASSPLLLSDDGLMMD